MKECENSFLPSHFFMIFSFLEQHILLIYKILSYSGSYICSQYPVFKNTLIFILKLYVTLPTKVRLVKAMVLPVVMYGCESWTVKKAECQRVDAFELWCWRRLLRVPWTSRPSNQSILKEISPGCSLEGLC